MATLSMMPSPHLSSGAHSRPLTPLNLSPGPSPQLRPKGSTSTIRASPIISTSLPSATAASVGGTNSSASTGTSPRSYARAPERRPYAPLLSSRASMQGPKVELEGDTKMFVELVAQLVVSRTQANIKMRGRKATAEGVEEKRSGSRSVSLSRARGDSPNNSPGSWDAERAELLVDVPVWSPGCFQDLSTLHSLRDRTLAQVHALLSHLISSHSIPASYHLLARSALATPSSPISHRPLPSPLSGTSTLPLTSSSSTPPSGPAKNHPHSRAKSHRHPGWGCIRLAPSVVSSPLAGKLELRPKVRRSSMDFATDSNAHSPHRRMGRVGSAHKRAATSPTSPVDETVLSASVSAAELLRAPVPGLGLGLETIPARRPLGAGACDAGVVSVAPAALKGDGGEEAQKDLGEGGETVLLESDSAVLVQTDAAVVDGEEEEGVHLKSGYTSGTVSDDEEEDADEVVMREIAKRGAKEGSIFLMTLFGSPALILV